MAASSALRIAAYVNGTLFYVSSETDTVAAHRAALADIGTHYTVTDIADYASDDDTLNWRWYSVPAGLDTNDPAAVAAWESGEMDLAGITHEIWGDN